MKPTLRMTLSVLELTVGLALQVALGLYLFDRPQYLIRRAAEKCTAAEMAKADYHVCRTVGYRDERCEYFGALYIERAGECEAADAAVDAEAYRRRAR